MVSFQEIEGLRDQILESIKLLLDKRAKDQEVMNC